MIGLFLKRFGIRIWKRLLNVAHVDMWKFIEYFIAHCGLTLPETHNSKYWILRCDPTEIAIRL